jgi:hypothetical protein
MNDQVLKKLFSNAKAFNSTILPKTGHGLNFHTNALEGYQGIMDFLSAQGL